MPFLNGTDEAKRRLGTRSRDAADRNKAGTDGDFDRRASGSSVPGSSAIFRTGTLPPLPGVLLASCWSKLPAGFKFATGTARPAQAPAPL